MLDYIMSRLRTVRRKIIHIIQLSKRNMPLFLKKNLPSSANYAGIIGCGHFFKYAYLPALNKKGIKLTCKSLISRNFDDSKYAQRNIIYKTNIYDDMEGFFNSGLNSIIITAPNNEHYNYILEAIKRNVNVFCEKPLVTECDQLLEIKEKLTKRQTILMVGFQYRYSDIYSEMLSLCRSNPLGEVIEVRVSHCLGIVDHVMGSKWLVSRKKSGGGVLFNAGIHSVNLLLALFGEVESCSAEFENRRLPKECGEDTAYCQLGFKNNIKADMVVSYLQGQNNKNEFKLTIVCKSGSADFDIKNNRIVYYDNESNVTFYNKLCDYDDILIYNELNHYNDCVLLNKKPDTDIDDYYNTHKILTALYK